MPAYNQNDQRHPHNRARLLYAGMVEGVGVGYAFTFKQLRTIIKLSCGVSAMRAIKDMVEDLVDFRMLEHPEDGVYIVASDGYALIG